MSSAGHTEAGGRSGESGAAADARRRRLPSILLLAVLWGVVAEGRPDVLWGGLVALPLALAAQRRIGRSGPPTARPRLARLPGFLAFFLRRSLQSGLDVALRALRPRLPLDPALLAYPLRLPPGASDVFLATVSLLPGTLSAGVEGERLRVHALDAALAGDSIPDAERRVATLFGLPWEAPR